MLTSIAATASPATTATSVAAEATAATTTAVASHLSQARVDLLFGLLEHPNKITGLLGI